jgi:hypothetical protein
MTTAEVSRLEEDLKALAADKLAKGDTSAWLAYSDAAERINAAFIDSILASDKRAKARRARSDQRRSMGAAR